MSAADGMFSAPKATSWAAAAFSRASKARAMAPLIKGFSSRSCAKSPEGVLALSGEALAQAVAAGFLVHAAERYRFQGIPGPGIAVRRRPSELI